MRDLYSYAERCKQTLDRLGVPYAKYATFQVNKTARRWGSCACYYGEYTIEVASTLLYEANAETGLLSTLYHELLHAVPGCMNHGPEWKRWAALVSKETGITIKRTDSMEECGVVEDHMPQPKYAVTCPDCGHVWVRYRMCKLIAHPEKFRCGNCKAALTRCAGVPARTA